MLKLAFHQVIFLHAHRVLLHMIGVESSSFTSVFENGVHVISASGIVNATPRQIVDAHTQRDNAALFRDIGHYTQFVKESDGSVRVAFPARIGVFRFPQMFHKRVISQGTGSRIEFNTPQGAIAEVKGAWDLMPINTERTMVSFNQQAHVPSWAKFLPVDGYIKSRVTRMMEDLAAINRPPPGNPS